ncbi:MAG: sigma-70 family RNA polymerase sigma factor [Dehalococcoidia bacterium]|nr:sigma-70 family RNA polymerase sigma factor [Dehalococcoidia bacterium]
MSREATATQEARLQAFTEHRTYLFAVAYRLLGIAEDAEDILQDAWLRFAGARVGEIEEPRAYLVTIVTRLSLDLLRSARRRREEYVGTWLPEPVPTAEVLPEDLVELSESASFAFLLLLERLNPVERAVVVLHDVFDYSHDEVGRMTGRTAAASRQSLRRARVKLGGATPPRSMPVDTGYLEDFLEATRAGDVERLVGLLAPDVVLLSDGGGVAAVAGRPLVGSEVVGRFLVAVTASNQPLHGHATTLNGQPALIGYVNGVLDTVLLVDVTAAGVTALYVVRNPEKLRRLKALLT